MKNKPEVIIKSNGATMPVSLAETMAQDAVASQVTSVSDVNPLTAKIVSLLELRAKIEAQETLLKVLKAMEEMISGTEIPQLMQERNVKKLVMQDGSVVECKPFYSVRITDETREAAFAWLRANGHGELIKTVVSAEYGTGDAEKLVLLLRRLQELGVENRFSQKPSVHPQTLKAFAKELVESGQPFDGQLFNLYIGNKTEIKTP